MHIRRARRGAAFPLIWRLFAVALTALCLATPDARAAFGLTSSGGYYVVDTGAGLVFKVNQSNGDINSLVYNGVEYQYSAKGSHINSGLGTTGVTVSATMVGTDFVKITVEATGISSAGTGTLTHYYMARRGYSHIYMATHFTEEPSIGLVRFIARIPNTLLPNGPAPSDIRNNTGAIESADIFGMADGTTRSKHYSNRRMLDWSYTGATGTGVAAWIVRSNHEGDSGGPFYRCLINQCGDQQELYEIVNYGEGQTEPFRFNVLNGPYALVFTDGTTPGADGLPGTPPSLDTSWVADMGLVGFVPSSGRGGVSCAGISNRDTAYRYTVGFANAAAQYWCDTAASNGSFTKAEMIPGTYTMTVYKNELAVYSASVDVAAGATTTVNAVTIAADPSAVAPLWRIGNWDGTPCEFVNGDKITTMHPSDIRMASWNFASPYVVGASSPAADMPCYHWKDVGGGGRDIQFVLTASQIAASTVRIGMTCAYAGGRPNIIVNSWTAGLQSASAQPATRTLTVGTYRGNNTTYTFSVPASALVVGTNTMRVYPISGSSGIAYLSPGYSLDCIEMYQGSVQTLAVPAAPGNLAAAGGDKQASLTWSAVAGASSYSVLRSTTSGGPYVTVASGIAGTAFTNTGLTNNTIYYYVVTASNTSGTGVPSVEAAASVAVPGTPAVPTSLAATPYDGSAALAWTGVFGATGYRVKRASTSGGPYAVVVSSAETSASDFGLTNGTAYYYVVSAYNTYGESADSAEVSVTPSQGATLVFESNAAQDGYVTGATGNAAGNSTSATGTTFRTGDSSGNLQYKGIVSFDTSSLPDDAAVTSATLKLRRASLTGTPTNSLGICYADIKAGAFSGNVALESADFQALPDASRVAQFAVPASNGAFSSGALGASGLVAIDRAGTTQLRVYFSTATDGDGGNDYVSWSSGNDTTAANRPILEVTYARGQAPSARPVAYVPFDEGTGTSARDITGNGWNGSLSNGAAWASGRVDGAVSLPTTNAHVALPANIASALGDFTVAAWVKPSALTAEARIFDFGTGTNNCIFLAAASAATGRPRYAIRTPSGGEQVVDAGVALTTNWAHVAVTFSGTTARLYVNGALSGANTNVLSRPSSLGGTTQNYLGKSQSSGNPAFAGALDEFQIYNQALSASNVALLASPPGAPTSAAARGSDGSATVSWVADAAEGYNIARSTNASGPYSTVASAVKGTNWSDAGLSNGTAYYYTVRAFNGMALGPSIGSAQVVPIATPTGLGATSSNGNVHLAWAASAGATGYGVRRSTNAAGPFDALGSASGTSYTDTSATPGATWYYAVTATNATGESPASSAVALTVAPAAPATLSAIPGDASVALSWSASTGTATYRIFRSLLSGSGFSEIASGVVTTTFRDSSAANGTTYYYVVTAVNSGGESPPSAEAVATPSSASSTVTSVTALTTGGNYNSSSNWSALGTISIAAGGTVEWGWNDTATSSWSFANDIILNGGKFYAWDGTQHLMGNVSVSASGGTLGSTFNAGAAEGGKGLYVEGTVSGSGPLTVDHTFNGTLNPWETSYVQFNNASNSYAGTITVQAATNGSGGGRYLGIGAETALQHATVVLPANNTGTNQFGASPLVFATNLPSAATVGALSGSGNVILLEYDTLGHSNTATPVALNAGGNGASTTYGGILSGAGSLIKSGAGTFTLTGSNTYSGGTIVAAGVLQIGNGGSAASITGYVTNNASLVFNRSNAYAFSGIIGGSGAITKAGPGTLTLSASNTFAGGTRLDAGILNIAHSSALGTGAVTAKGGATINIANSTTFVANAVQMSGALASLTLTTSSATGGMSGAFSGSADQTVIIAGATQVNLNGTTKQFQSMPGTVAILAGSGLAFRATALNNGGDQTTFDVNGVLTTRNGGALALGALQGVGTVTSGTSTAGTLTCTIGAKGTSTTFSGTIADGGTNNRVAIVKTGAGTQTLSGPCTYSGATTVSAGKLTVNGSLASTNVTVAATAALGGTGAVLGPTTCSGTLAPGASPGTLSFASSLALASTSVLDYELGTASDRTTVAGNLVLDGTINITAGAGFAAGTYTIFTYGGSLTDNTLIVGTIPSGFRASIDTSTAGQVSLVLTATTPSVPSDLAALAGNAQVSLAWTSASNAMSYRVKRSADGTTFVVIANTAALNHLDTGVTNGTTYYYAVSAVNADGESANSATVSARPTAPISPGEVLSPPISSPSTGAPTLSVQSVPGHTYQVQYCDDLVAGAWINSDDIIAGDGSVLNLLAPYDPSVQRRFYRVLVQP